MPGFTRKGPNAPPGKPETAPAPVAQKSGRATFDERGRTVWEWQVRTGRFDLNADSQKVRALTDVELSLDDGKGNQPPQNREAGFSPYASEPLTSRPKPTRDGMNPYSTGPAKRPEAVSYDPYRTQTPRPAAATVPTGGTHQRGEPSVRRPPTASPPPRKPPTR